MSQTVNEKTTTLTTFLPLTKEEEKKCFGDLTNLFKSATHRMEESTWLEQIENGNQTLIKLLQMSTHNYNYLLNMESHANGEPTDIPFFLLYRPNENNYILLMMMFGFARAVYRVCSTELEEMKKKVVVDQMHHEVNLLHQLHWDELYKQQIKMRNTPRFSSTSVFSCMLAEHDPKTSVSPNSWDIKHDDKLIKSYLINLRECFRIVSPMFELFLQFYPRLVSHHSFLQKSFAKFDVLNDLFISLKNENKIFCYESVIEIMKLF